MLVYESPLRAEWAGCSDPANASIVERSSGNCCHFIIKMPLERDPADCCVFFLLLPPHTPHPHLLLLFLLQGWHDSNGRTVRVCPPRPVPVRESPVRGRRTVRRFHRSPSQEVFAPICHIDLEVENLNGHGHHFFVRPLKNLSRDCSGRTEREFSE